MLVSFISEKELLIYSAATEQNSEHIIAKAIVNYAKSKGVIIPKSQGFQAIPGKGAKAKINDKDVYVGSPSLLKELNLQTTDAKVLDLQKTGKTVVFTVVEGKIAGVFALADIVRERITPSSFGVKGKGDKGLHVDGGLQRSCKGSCRPVGH